MANELSTVQLQIGDIANLFEIRGTDRCERRSGEPKNQALSCEIIAQ